MGLVPATAPVNEQIRPAAAAVYDSSYSASASVANWFLDGRVGEYALDVAAAQLLCNGATLDRARSTADLGTLINAVGATTTQTSADLTNWNHRGLLVALNISNVGTGSITPFLDAKDPVSGLYFPMGALSTALTTNALSLYGIYPAALTGTAYSGTVLDAVLPRTFRVRVVANNANPATYTVGATLIL